MLSDRYAHTDIITDRHSHGQTCSRADILTKKCSHTDILTDRHAHWQTWSQTCLEIDMLSDRHVHTKTWSLTCMHAHGQTCCIIIIIKSHKEKWAVHKTFPTWHSFRELGLKKPKVPVTYMEQPHKHSCKVPLPFLLLHCMRFNVISYLLETQCNNEYGVETDGP